MRQIPLAVQAYSVRDAFAADFAGTLKELKQMGYQGVEFFSAPAYPAAEIKIMIDDVGLLCCGWHISWKDIQPENLDKTIEFHKILGNTRLVIASLPQECFVNLAAAQRTCAFMTDVCQKLRPCGMQLGFHNHWVEFKPLVDCDLPLWDIIAEHTPDDFIMQFDTGNALRGGGDACIYLKQYAGRSMSVHLKPYSLTTEFNALPGTDDIAWDKVFNICEQIGNTQWFVAEFECEESFDQMTGIREMIKRFRAMQQQGIVNFGI